MPSPIPMHWFGPESWGAPVCETNPRTPTPVGERCEDCGEGIVAGDKGVQFILERGPWALAFHLRCFMRTLGITMP